jgi:hypothetical protein
MVEEISSPKASDPSPISPQYSKDSVRILVDLRMSNGLHVHQNNLSYQYLRALIEKLEKQYRSGKRPIFRLDGYLI